MKFYKLVAQTKDSIGTVALCDDYSQFTVELLPAFESEYVSALLQIATDIKEEMGDHSVEVNYPVISNTNRLFWEGFTQNIFRFLSILVVPNEDSV